MSISSASVRGTARAALCAALLAALAACAMPSHPDSLAPTSDPFNPATIQLIDNTDWTLQSWRGGDGAVHALPSRPVTLSLSTRTGVRHASGNAACNRYSGSYALKNGMLNFGPLATTFMACPAPSDGAFEHAYLDALGHVVNAGAQLSEPQALYLVTEDGATLTFKRGAP
jgi:heat shock protein HslJ